MKRLDVRITLAMLPVLCPGGDRPDGIEMRGLKLYIGPMSKRKSSKRWRISRIRSNKAEQLGTVEAADAQAAIRTAIKSFGITNPEHQRRLAARPDS